MHFPKPPATNRIFKLLVFLLGKKIPSEVNLDSHGFKEYNPVCKHGIRNDPPLSVPIPKGEH